MDKLEVLNKLILDLRAFLLVLDKETLTPFARAQKRSICDLLSTLEDPPTEDTEYMVMTCPSGEASSQMKIKEPADMGVIPWHIAGYILGPILEVLLYLYCKVLGNWRTVWSICTGLSFSDGLHPSVAHLSAAEEASFSSAPDWLLKGGSDPMMPSSFPVNLDGLWHERTELFDAVTGTTVEMGSDGSLYDSYGEEKDDEEEEDSVKDQTHYLAWTTSQPILHPVSESHLCGFLWRRRWLGQWSKQLFVIRSHTLLCYRCTGDLHPLLEMSLEGCHVLYRSKPRGKVPHQLKVLASSQTLVLGFHSWPQAQEWRKVWR